MFSNMHEVGVNLVELSKSFLGQWVALDPDSHAVLASGRSAKAVLEAAEEKGAECPLLLFVSNEYGTYAP